MHSIIWFLLAFVIFCFIVIVRFLIKFTRRKEKILKYVQHLSSPKEYPIIGSALRFLGKSSEGEYSITTNKEKANCRWFGLHHFDGL